MQIKELIIEGEFTVKGLPSNLKQPLKYLRITAKMLPDAIFQIDECVSKKERGRAVIRKI